MWIKTNCNSRNVSIINCYKFYIRECFGMKDKKYVLNGVATRTFWGEDIQPIAYFSSEKEATIALDEIISFLNSSPNAVFEFKNMVTL